jgi:hypothetical protein
MQKLGEKRRTLNMTYLKFYRLEREKFPEQSEIRIPDRNVSKFTRKLTNHFDIKLDTLKLRGFNGSGIAYTGENRIGLSHNPTVLLIVHELGHLYTKQKLGEHKHNKNLMRFVGQAVRYSSKKKYWNLEASQSENFDSEREKRKGLFYLVSFSKCPVCDFVMTWNLPAKNRTFYKAHYAVNTVHDMTCSRCKNRTKQTIIEQRKVSMGERQEQLREIIDQYSNRSLVVVPVSERSLMVQVRATDIKLYAIPLENVRT